jgi:hypothetical protein
MAFTSTNLVNRHNRSLPVMGGARTVSSHDRSVVRRFLLQNAVKQSHLRDGAKAISPMREDVNGANTYVRRSLPD